MQNASSVAAQRPVQVGAEVFCIEKATGNAGGFRLSNNFQTNDFGKEDSVKDDARRPIQRATTASVGT